MESLYTKYRPQTFADVVGQKHVVTTLEHAVIEGRTSHAYLFCGPRGTGKTTMARLLAKALLCEQGEGHLPDGTCETCQLIAAGEHPDVYELDAASRTGVDNVRDEIISRVNFAPARGAYKMYIIDEVHMLTTAAFNALLKTLEEPPSHVVFVLCTTDPQKIPETILSRVQRFDFHAIGNADIQQRLAYICEREGFAYDPEAIELVVRHARGGMRDAISELEQLSVSGGGTISVDVARDVLGEVSASTLERMSLAMANRDVPALFAQVESLVEVGRDLLQFTRALAARLRDVYVVAAIGATSGIVAAPDDELPAISQEARAFGSVDRVARALSLLSDASTEMRVAPNQRLVLEVALTKIARPQTELTLEALADRVASLERQVVALSTPGARRSQEEPSREARQERSQNRGAGGTQPSRDASSGPAAQVVAPDAREHANVAAGQGAASETRQAGATAPERNQREARPEAVAQQASAQREVAATSQVTQSATSVAAASTQPNANRMPQAPAPQADHAASTRPTSGSTQAAAADTAGARRPAPQATGRPQPSGAQQGARPGAPSAAPSAPSMQARGGQGVQSAAQSAPSTAPAAAPASSGITDPGELQRRWKQVVDGLLAAHPQHGSLLMQSVIVADDGGQLTVSLPKGSTFACRMLERADVRANVDPMIAQVFGPRKTRFGEGLQSAAAAASTPSPAPSPAQRAPEMHASAPAQGSAARDSRRLQSAVPHGDGAGHMGPQPSAGAPQPANAPTAPTPAQTPDTNASRQPQASAMASQPAPSQRSATARQQAPVEPQRSASAPVYPAPWEPASLGEDDVPYDDADFTPYEEEFAFDPTLASQITSQAQAPTAQHARNEQVASRAQAAGGAQNAMASTTPAAGTPGPAGQMQQVSGFSQANVPATPPAAAQLQPWMERTAEPQVPSMPAQEPAGQFGSASVTQPAATTAQPAAAKQTAAPAAQPTTSPAAQTAAAPDPWRVPTAPSEPAPEPESVPESAPEPQPEPAPASQPEAAAEPAVAKPRRKRRVSGIPADIVSMMTEIFGEGVTYTSIPPEDEDAAENAVEDEAASYDEGESEFVEEPVDDADYDDED